MAAPSYRAQSSSYVENQQGWRFLFFSLALSCVAGLGFRLYFSPQKIKQWTSQALESQAGRYDIRFRDAELSLARGAIPQFAIVLKGVEVGPRPACSSVPALKVSELRIPLQFRKLLSGEVGLGVISGGEVIVDVDGFKTDCAAQKSHPIAPMPHTHVEPVAQKPNMDGRIQSWWTSDQLKQAQRAVAGFEFDRVEVWFEKRAKRLVLESLSLTSDEGEDVVHLTTDLRVPPEVTYGEAIPPLTIEADARGDSAEVSIQAELSEGTLEGVAHLKPLVDHQLDIDAHVAVSSLPLSTMVPLLTKAGIVKENFRPKFLWMDCAAEIKGRFQGLFRENPLRLKDCSIEGGGGQIRVEEALRHPDGGWDPFRVRIETVDLRKMIETFGAKGPDGVADDFGRVSGELAVKSFAEARFEGVFEGAQVRFSSRSVRALQRVARMEAKLDLQGERMFGSVDRVELERGQFDGSLRFDADREFRTGSVKIQVKNLVLDPIVQRVLVAGEIGRMTGQGDALIGDGKVVSVKGDWRVEHLNGHEFRFKNADVRTDYGGGDFHVTVRAPILELSRVSPLFIASQPLFFGHAFRGDWIPVEQTLIRATVSDREGVRWEKAEGRMENGKIALVSAGGLTRQRQLSGWVSIDYPAVKKLKWTLAGTTTTPVFGDDSKALEDLRQRMKIDDATLGLPVSEDSKKEELTGVRAAAVKTTRGLRELGERVIEKAREIVPAVSGRSKTTTPAASKVPAPVPNSGAKVSGPAANVD